MAENQSNRSRSFSGGVPGEKPVINEKIEPYFPLNENRFRLPATPLPVKDTVSTEAENAGNSPVDDSSFKKGLRLFQMNRWESALKELLLVDGGSLTDEEQAELAYYMGLCCTKLERFDEALLYFEQLITMDDPLRVYQCRMILAYIYVKIGRAKMAEFELEHLLDSGFESVSLYNTLAYAAYLQKHYLKAVEYYEKSLDLDKDNATAMNSLGYILADTGLDKLRALRLCRKAVDKNPKNAAYLDSLGWASYKCGNLTEARNWLRRAIDIAPREDEIKKHFRVVNGEGKW